MWWHFWYVLEFLYKYLVIENGIECYFWISIVIIDQFIIVVQLAHFPLRKNPNQTSMETLIIRTQSKRNFRLLKELATQLGESVEIVSPEKAEDLTFGKMMEETKTGTYTSREAIMEALKIKHGDDQQ